MLQLHIGEAHTCYSGGLHFGTPSCKKLDARLTGFTAVGFGAYLYSVRYHTVQVPPHQLMAARQSPVQERIDHRSHMLCSVNP